MYLNIYIDIFTSGVFRLGFFFWLTTYILLIVYRAFWFLTQIKCVLAINIRFIFRYFGGLYAVVS